MWEAGDWLWSPQVGTGETQKRGRSSSNLHLLNVKFFFFFSLVPSVKSFICSDDQSIAIYSKAAHNLMTGGLNGLSDAEPSNGCDPGDNGSIVFSQHWPNHQAGGCGGCGTQSRVDDSFCIFQTPDDTFRGCSQSFLSLLAKAPLPSPPHLLDDN